MNEFFQISTEAQKLQLDSFQYKGTTYIKLKTKSGMVVYKQK